MYNSIFAVQGREKEVFPLFIFHTFRYTGDMIQEKAYGKLNLTLGVLFKRQDGYHALDTLMTTVSLWDDIVVEPSRQVEVLCEGMTLPFENTMYKAAMGYKERTGRGALIRCKKRLPSEAGMGGGSADAAAVLRALQKQHRLLDDRELYQLALSVGADVPFCLHGGMCRCEGVGEILTPVQCPTLHFAVMKPEMGVSTKALFTRLPMPRPRVDTGRAMALLCSGRLTEAAPLLQNALEAPAVELVPVIGEIKEKLLQQGALASCMTGSGSAVFGLFTEEATARQAVEALGGQYPYVAYCHSV